MRSGTPNCRQQSSICALISALACYIQVYLPKGLRTECSNRFDINPLLVLVMYIMAEHHVRPYSSTVKYSLATKMPAQPTTANPGLPVAVTLLE